MTEYTSCATVSKASPFSVRILLASLAAILTVRMLCSLEPESRFVGVTYMYICDAISIIYGYEYEYDIIYHIKYHMSRALHIFGHAAYPRRAAGTSCSSAPYRPTR